MTLLDGFHSPEKLVHIHLTKFIRTSSVEGRHECILNSGCLKNGAMDSDCVIVCQCCGGPHKILHKNCNKQAAVLTKSYKIMPIHATF